MNRFLVLIALCSTLSCACSKDGGEMLHIVPDKVDLTWESQQFQVTCLEHYYIVKTLSIDEAFQGAPMRFDDLSETYSFDLEWLHWSYKKGNDYATVSVDANDTGKVRHAQINMVDGCDAWGRLTITQQPKE